MLDALAALPPPQRSFASDNWAGAHPDVIAAVVEANQGHAPAYGDDQWTRELGGRFSELFDRPVETFLTFGGTGGNVAALHALTGRDSTIVCTADAHIARGEAGAPEHITGAQLSGYPWDQGKLRRAQIDDAARRLRHSYNAERTDVRHVVSLTQATELGTAYTPDELADLCDTAHGHGMVVHVDGARLVNALAAWPGDNDLAARCRLLAGCGVDVVVVGGTKAGLLGAEAVLFLTPGLATDAAFRRKQVTQTASKMRFLAAQFLAAIEADAVLDWARHANTMARRLADGLSVLRGADVAVPVDTNSVFTAMPPAVVEHLEAWTPFHVWDPSGPVVRFVAAWDTEPDDVDRLVAGIAACITTAERERGGL
jgi:threonine aldolase